MEAEQVEAGTEFPRRKPTITTSLVHTCEAAADFMLPTVSRMLTTAFLLLAKTWKDMAKG